MTVSCRRGDPTYHSGSSDGPDADEVREANLTDGSTRVFGQDERMVIGRIEHFDCEVAVTSAGICRNGRIVIDHIGEIKDDALAGRTHLEARIQFEELPIRFEVGLEFGQGAPSEAEVRACQMIDVGRGP